MTTQRLWLVSLMAVACSSALHADRLTMRTGTRIDGTYVGGDQHTVRFRSMDGTIKQYAVLDVSELTFTVREVPAAAPAAAARMPDPARKPSPIDVPAGTVVNVRLTQDIDVDVTQTGAKFKARVDDPVMIGGRVVIPREAVAVVQAARVQQSGTMKGSDQISLKLNSISFGGRAYEVATEYASVQVKGEGKRTARKVGGGAGLGGLVGGLAGGGEGVVIGAVVGGIAGTAVAASGEEHLRLPAETRLQFKLSAAVRVEP
jgi:outer membrane lipoprotein SlyB